MTVSKQDNFELFGDANDPYGEAAREVVDLANRVADANPGADLWDISDGMLMGAIHYWLYARQPCDDPMCEECEPVSSSDQRLVELQRLVESFARESDYFQSVNDMKIGRA